MSMVQERKPPPNRRASLAETVTTPDGCEAVGRVGFDPITGALFELFVSISEDDVRAIAAKEAAVALSHAMQRGATIDELRKDMPRDEAGRPEGVIGALLDRFADGAIK